ncbi:MAG: hypothetical protein R3213_11960 [Flavobacteriaceae bacterium]|nr:hypothetical protein [Flavobacteriaceae bacterium]
MEKLQKILEIDYLEEGILNEAGLSRILQHTEDSFAIITAFRGNFSLAENRKRNRKLEAALKPLKAGGIKLTGHWEEAPDGVSWEDAKKTGRVEDVVEESYFIPKPSSISVEDFRAELVKLAKKFNQDAFVFDDGRNLTLVGKNGKVIDKLGSKATFGKIGQAYSTLRGRPKTNFVFEGTIDPSNNLHRQSLTLRGLSWVK